MYGLTKRDPMLDLLYQLESRMGRSFGEPQRTFEWLRSVAVSLNNVSAPLIV